MTQTINPSSRHARRGLWRFNLQTHPNTIPVNLASTKRPSNAELYRHVPTAEIVRLFDQGLSHRKIGKLLDMGPCSVGHRLRQQGKRRESLRITPEELKECRMDPAWEARRGFADRVVCRECGEFKAGINANGEHSHLRKHNMTADDYAAKYFGARFVSFARAAAQSAKQGRNTTTQQLMERFAAKYLTPSELAECRQDQEWEEHHRVMDFVVCRLCGLKSKTDLWSHLRRHGYTSAAYREQFPKAEQMPLGLKRGYKRILARRYDAHKREKLAQAELVLASARPKEPLRRGRPPVAETTIVRVRTAVQNELPKLVELFKRRTELHKSIRTNPRLLAATLLKDGFSQDHIDAAFASQSPLIAARRFISNTFKVNGHHLDYDTVAQYDLRGEKAALPKSSLQSGSV